VITGLIRMAILGVVTLALIAGSIAWRAMSPAQRLSVFASLRSGDSKPLEEQASRDAERFVEEHKEKATVEAKRLANEIVDEATVRLKQELREEADKATQKAKAEIKKEAREMLEKPREAPVEAAAPQ